MTQSELLSPAYQQQLQEIFPSFNVAQCNDVRYAPLPNGEEELAFVRIGPDHRVSETARPVMYVPGFSEGMVAKMPFAVELASRGLNVLLPDQNRVGILKDTTNKKSATYTQAVNMMAVLDHELLSKERGSVDVVTHSYGSLIFDAMRTIAEERGLHCFDDSEVVMLAPAGLNPRESKLSLGRRFTQMLVSESRSRKQFTDLNNEMFRANAGNMAANIPRALRECLELSTRKVDLNGPKGLLRSNIGRVTVMTYADDPLFTDKLVSRSLGPIFEEDSDESQKLSWMVPVSFDNRGRVTDATHNDEQFNPARVGHALSGVLFNAQDRRSGLR